MRFIRHLHHDTRGNVLMLTGLAILILFAVAGAGVDFGRQQLVRMKLQNASDAAAVAAASMPDSVSADQRRAVALRYYNLNFPATYLGIARPTPNIQVGSQIIVDASTSFDANFVSNVGVNRLESQGRTVVDRSAPQQTIYDVILVMDNSRSMADTTNAPQFTPVPSALQANALASIKFRVCVPQLITYLQSTYCTLPYLYRVPMPDGSPTQQFTAGNCVSNAPREYCNRVSSGPTVYTSNSERMGYGITGSSRLNALRTVALNFVNRIITEGAAGSRIGIVTWSSDLINTVDLTDNAEQASGVINQMAAWGGTAPAPAMQQALSVGNRFNPRHVKAVVFMSDGKPTEQANTNACNSNNFCQPAVNATLPICTQMKNSGVQVYTVGFLNPSDQEFAGEPGSYNRAVSFLRSCASTDAQGAPRYYTAQNGQQLDAAFSEILTSLGRIRIAQ